MREDAVLAAQLPSTVTSTSTAHQCPLLADNGQPTDPSRQPHPLLSGHVSHLGYGYQHVPDLLAQLELAGAFITMDAMGCQKSVAQAIVKQKADYVLALKYNRGGRELARDLIWQSFAKPYSTCYSITTAAT